MLKTIVSGNIGQAAEVRVLDGNTKVINFSVAHNEKYKDKNGVKVEKTTWVRCSWFTEKTKVAEYLIKGQGLIVEGKPSTSHYTNDAGETKSHLELRVISVELVGGSKKAENDKAEGKEPQASDSDDLPF